jgi:hypothetical protein
VQHRLRKLAASRKGRERLRERVAIEHRLAHVGRKQGRHARYLGVRKNVFDLRRVAAVVNLETITASACRLLTCRNCPHLPAPERSGSFF